MFTFHGTAKETIGRQAVKLLFGFRELPFA